jgi:hypothetical protein
MSEMLKRIGESNRLTLGPVNHPWVDLRGWPAFWWTLAACAAVLTLLLVA